MAPDAFSNLEKEIELIQAQAQNRLNEVTLNQTINQIDTQGQQARQDFINASDTNNEEEKLEARRKFNEEIVRLENERIDAQIASLDRQNEEELLKIEELETKKAELNQKFREDRLGLELKAIEDRYQALEEAEEVAFLERTATEEELRKEIIEENFEGYS